MPVDISSWLRDIDDSPSWPHQDAYPAANPTTATQPRGRKRSRGHSSTSENYFDHAKGLEAPTRLFAHPTPPPDSPTRSKTAANDPISSIAEMSSNKKRKTGSGAPAAVISSPLSNRSANNHTVNDGDEVEEETPRPRRHAHIPSDASSLSSASRSSRSGLSGASSPRKQLAAMALSNHAVQIRAMSDPSLLPPSLAEIRAKLMQFSRGRGILGEHALAGISDQSAARALHPDLALIHADSDFYCSPRRDDLGPTPHPEDVLYLLECAADCLRLGRSETAWNHEVHFPLLTLALRPRTIGSVFQRLIKVTTCSTASIIKDYRVRYAPDKKIDFCVYIDPQYDNQDSEIARSVDTVRAQLPLLSINPTDDLALLCHPIAIPIETKRPGEGLDTANLQVATFLSAHFALLRRLVDTGSAMPAEDGQSVPSIDDIGFLPGLIIQGNTWNFIAASREESRIVIWSETTLGSTGDIFGIYQIIASLQLLRNWVYATYWPWLRRVIQRAALARGISATDAW
ncbi:hypothetical protein NM208_g437 [Fusarium decemcellulare]|uniref:Uncharacterized protein n=1 Tax=Fusarium decemcellulare TaxID=57161 RepID=A0ACC1SZD1_9HYPO|nr:hypothetical protein NM208_g437 [Fusarium decemcellulare]